MEPSSPIPAVRACREWRAVPNTTLSFAGIAEAVQARAMFVCSLASVLPHLILSRGADATLPFLGHSVQLVFPQLCNKLNLLLTASPSEAAHRSWTSCAPSPGTTAPPVGVACAADLYDHCERGAPRRLSEEFSYDSYPYG